MSKELTQQDYKEAAKLLNCEISDIMAIAEVESARAGFQSDGKPVILFERHKFHKYSNGRFSKTHPQISNPIAGGYLGGTKEWDRFDEAFKLDKKAAMMSISMGKFQICGFNFSLAGYNSVEEFYDAMFISEGEQLKAFCNFLLNSHLDDELRENRWTDLARGYNGATYKKNKYDQKLKKADEKFEKRGVDVDKEEPQIENSGNNLVPSGHSPDAEPVVVDPVPATKMTGWSNWKTTVIGWWTSAGVSIGSVITYLSDLIHNETFKNYLPILLIVGLSSAALFGIVYLLIRTYTNAQRERMAHEKTILEMEARANPNKYNVVVNKNVGHV